ncbi:AAA family ATPase [Deltaproteobacteria bacterium TL4]
MNKILAIVGMCGAGKSTACDFILEHRWQYIRFGQITIDKLKAEGKPITPENEKAMRETLRQQYGMGAFAQLSLPLVEKALRGSNVVIDGLYSWAEYKILKERFSDTLQVLAIYTSPTTRYQRLQAREHAENDKDHKMRKLSPEEAKRRDFAEIENIEKGGPIAMADYTINNESSLEDLARAIKSLL